MGYHTDFDGSLTITPSVKPEHAAYLRQFCETRRMKRNAAFAETLDDPIRIAAGLPIGEDGAYFVGAGGFLGQDSDASVVDYNNEPAGQPSLWCHWTVHEDGDALCWNEGEKFYSYTDWLEYLIKHFYGPWGYTLNGEISWSGEDDGDRGIIYVKDNAVEAVGDNITNPGPSWQK